VGAWPVLRGSGRDIQPDMWRRSQKPSKRGSRRRSDSLCHLCYLIFMGGKIRRKRSRKAFERWAGNSNNLNTEKLWSTQRTWHF
jgi:hypothetical protein